MALMAAWMSMLRLTALEWEFKVAAYWTAQLAAHSSASNTDIYHERRRRWDLMIKPDGWR